MRRDASQPRHWSSSARLKGSANSPGSSGEVSRRSTWWYSAKRELATPRSIVSRTDFR